MSGSFMSSTAEKCFNVVLMVIPGRMYGFFFTWREAVADCRTAFSQFKNVILLNSHLLLMNNAENLDSTCTKFQNFIV